MNVSALMMWKTIGLVYSSLSLKSEFRIEVLVVVLTIHEYENKKNLEMIYVLCRNQFLTVQVQQGKKTLKTKRWRTF